MNEQSQVDKQKRNRIIVYIIAAILLLLLIIFLFIRFNEGNKKVTQAPMKVTTSADSKDLKKVSASPSLTTSPSVSPTSSVSPSPSVSPDYRTGSTSGGGGGSLTYATTNSYYSDGGSDSSSTVTTTAYNNSTSTATTTAYSTSTTTAYSTTTSTSTVTTTITTTPQPTSTYIVLDENGDFDVTGTIDDDSSFGCSNGSIGTVYALTDSSETSGIDASHCELTTANVDGWQLTLESSNTAGVGLDEDYAGELRKSGTGTYADHMAFSRYNDGPNPEIPTGEWIDPTDAAVFGFRVSSGDHVIDRYLAYDPTPLITEAECGTSEPTATFVDNTCWAGIPNYGSPAIIASDTAAATTEVQTGFQYRITKANYWLAAGDPDEYIIEIIATLVLL